MVPPLTCLISSGGHVWIPLIFCRICHQAEFVNAGPLGWGRGIIRSMSQYRLVMLLFFWRRFRSVSFRNQSQMNVHHVGVSWSGYYQVT
jgi:hypothetical protein